MVTAMDRQISKKIRRGARKSIRTVSEVLKDSSLASRNGQKEQVTRGQERWEGVLITYLVA